MLDADQYKLTTRYDSADGFVGPCELVIAGATR